MDRYPLGFLFFSYIYIHYFFVSVALIFCPLLDKDISFENLYIVLSYPIK